MCKCLKLCWVHLHKKWEVSSLSSACSISKHHCMIRQACLKVREQDFLAVVKDQNSPAVL